MAKPIVLTCTQYTLYVVTLQSLHSILILWFYFCFGRLTPKISHYTVIYETWGQHSISLHTRVTVHKFTKHTTWVCKNYDSEQAVSLEILSPFDGSMLVVSLYVAKSGLRSERKTQAAQQALALISRLNTHIFAPQRTWKLPCLRKAVYRSCITAVTKDAC